MTDNGHPSHAEPDGDAAKCGFCLPELHASAVAEHGTVLAIEDSAPVADGHLLVITRRHARDLFDMTDQELRDAMTLLTMLRQSAQSADSTITGFNVGSNCGASAGQRVFHAHLHFIPRRDHDDPNERPIKGVIRNKMSY